MPYNTQQLSIYMLIRVAGKGKICLQKRERHTHRQKKIKQQQQINKETGMAAIRLMSKSPGSSFLSLGYHCRTASTAYRNFKSGVAQAEYDASAIQQQFSCSILLRAQLDLTTRSNQRNEENTFRFRQFSLVSSCLMQFCGAQKSRCRNIKRKCNAISNIPLPQEEAETPLTFCNVSRNPDFTWL